MPKPEDLSTFTPSESFEPKSQSQPKSFYNPPSPVQQTDPLDHQVKDQPDLIQNGSHGLSRIQNSRSYVSIDSTSLPQSNVQSSSAVSSSPLQQQQHIEGQGNVSRSPPWQPGTWSQTTSPPQTSKGDHHVSTSMVHLKDEPSRLPLTQNPYITLLQKNRGEQPTMGQISN